MRLFIVTTLFLSMLVYSHSECSAQAFAAKRASKIDGEVASLIQKMVHKRTEHKTFADLEALGCPAVPLIIRRMDDRRKLPDPRISLQNKSPDAFEGLRHYGSEEVVDALAAILNQLTGQDFGGIENGGSDAERTKAVEGWQEWLRKTPAERLCI